jgi:hypothetical protein
MEMPRKLILSQKTPWKRERYWYSPLTGMHTVALMLLQELQAFIPRKEWIEQKIQAGLIFLIYFPRLT